MPEKLVITNTSPLLYLHQIGYLEILQKLYGLLTVPTAVQQELAIDQQQEIAVPM